MNISLLLDAMISCIFQVTQYDCNEDDVAGTASMRFWGEKIIFTHFESLRLVEKFISTYFDDFDSSG